MDGVDDCVESEGTYRAFIEPCHRNQTTVNGALYASNPDYTSIKVPRVHMIPRCILREHAGACPGDKVFSPDSLERIPPDF